MALRSVCKLLAVSGRNVNLNLPCNAGSQIVRRTIVHESPATTVTRDRNPRNRDSMEVPPSFGKPEVTITVPLKLQQRLVKKLEKEKSQSYQRQLQVAKSREGSKRLPVLVAKRPEYNHYKGQSYGRKEDIPLASKGWKSRQSAGDYFIIQSIEEENFVEIEGKSTFQELGLRNIVVEAAKAAGFEKPTIAQMTAIPEILSGQHNLIAAETGCGKTMAYLLPLLDQILRYRRTRLDRPPNQPYAIILAPTRELVEQLFQVALPLCKTLGVKLRALQGGQVENKLINASTKEVEILISSISIISTMSAMEAIDTSKVFHIVLDEADTLLDDSFNDEVIRFLSRFQLFREKEHFRPVQLTLVSATMPRSVEEILGEVVPVDTLQRVTTPGLHRIVKAVPQIFKRVRKIDKPEIILHLANEACSKKQPLIIFANKTKTCMWLHGHLTRNGIECVTLNKTVRHHNRKQYMEMFMGGEVHVLVCTDVGSRGIDTVNTKHVVNYEFPNYLADYVHRSGRVGRVGSVEGCKITNLITAGNEIELVQEIELSLRKDESLKQVNANIKRILNSKYGMYKTIDPIGPNES